MLTSVWYTRSGRSSMATQSARPASARACATAHSPVPEQISIFTGRGAVPFFLLPLPPRAPGPAAPSPAAAITREKQRCPAGDTIARKRFSNARTSLALRSKAPSARSSSSTPARSSSSSPKDRRSARTSASATSAPAPASAPPPARAPAPPSSRKSCDENTSTCPSKTRRSRYRVRGHVTTSTCRPRSERARGSPGTPGVRGRRDGVPRPGGVVRRRRAAPGGGEPWS